MYLLLLKALYVYFRAQKYKYKTHAAKCSQLRYAAFLDVAK